MSLFKKPISFYKGFDRCVIQAIWACHLNCWNYWQTFVHDILIFILIPIAALVKLLLLLLILEICVTFICLLLSLLPFSHSFFYFLILVRDLSNVLIERIWFYFHYFLYFFNIIDFSSDVYIFHLFCLWFFSFFFTFSNGNWTIESFLLVLINI